ncbi:MAG: GNAT family N-acetyltransferase [Oscillospiraceae bacterium]
MIRFAQDKDYDQLKHIWQACFGDDEAYRNLFFETRYQTHQTIVYEEKDRVVAMLHLLPLELHIKGQYYKGKYIYAVGTLKEYRGKGISTNLLSFADNYLQKQAIDCVILVPATPSLFSFYEQRGFDFFSDIGGICIHASELLQTDTRITSTVSTLLELQEQRTVFFGTNSTFVAWDKDTLGYLDLEIIQTGGQVITLRNDNNGIGYVVCYMEDKLLTIKEIVVENLLIEDVIFHLYEKFSFENCNINIKSDFLTKYQKKILPFSLIKWYNNKIMKEVLGTTPYMGLVSD